MELPSVISPTTLYQGVSTESRFSKMIYDVAIIGAGPAGLAVAARLREATPSALFTDEEHSRYWRRFNRRETFETEAKRRRRSNNSESGSDSSKAFSEKIDRCSRCSLQ
ncbi:hypothetical protein PV11_02604 [Exophiala sideris]|uniref:FAD/NAD(P)-binding domain-containing protein n=1 Tax=Exophiala sideris TaxID=1016849 RepID=A0A0D1YWY0_9EURO|nr:hypothetical protein PV11_02604 [Exophiala sideris]